MHPLNPTRTKFHCWWLRQILPLAFALLVTASTPAATGDLVVVCYNADGNDDFALIALANIPGGTRYFITDSGWSTALNNLVQEGASPSPCRQIQFDVAAGGIAFGTVIKFDQSGANVVLMDPSLGTLTMVDRFAATGSPLLTKLSFGSAGDHILIYQTAGNTVGGAVTMVSAFSGSTYQNLAPAPPDPVMTQANGWQVGTVPQPSQTGATAECNAPAGLVVYNGANASTATALGLASFLVGGVTNQDNYKYNGAYGLADKTAYLTAINNPANWLANDVTPFDLATVGPTPIAEINLMGNGANIADGSVTPVAADFTLFGSVPVSSGTFARTFTIQNVGTSSLVISNAGITISGANAAEFTVSSITLPVTLAASGSTNFVVTFDPSAAGLRNATVNIANSDSNENPYNFAIQGQGFNYTAPAGTPPPLRWSSTVHSNNVGAVRGVGSTTNGDVIAVSKIGAGTGSNLRVTRHASLTGTTNWSRDYNSGNSDDANDVLVDQNTGDTYIAARASINTTNLNWFVHKVNGDGTAGWTYTFDSTAVNLDECFALTRASDGNVVAVGMTTTPSGSFARAARINANTGAEMNAYVSPVNLSQFNAVAADAVGNVYATGLTTDVNQNAITVKLNATLGLVWSQTFDGTNALADSFAHVTVHPASGDCVVAGTTRVNTTNLDAIVIRYAAAAPGTEVWRRVISGSVPGSEAVNNLVVDAAGDFYLAGAIRNLTSTDRDALLAKITGSSGALAWTTTRQGSAADSSDRFQNVRVAGTAVYAVGNLDNTNRDIFASRFNAGTGVEEWTTNYNGGGNGADEIFFGKSVMTLIASNAIAIGGETLDVSANTNGIVLKYAPQVPPVVSNVTKTNNEDTVLTFAAADFTPGSYTDPDGQALATVRVTSLPTNGQLKTNGNTFAAPLDIAIANIGALTYTPGTNYNGSDSFGWNGSDGTAFAVSGALVNLTIREVNDAPTGTNDVLSDVFANTGTRTNSIASLVANDSKGPANESGQVLTIINVGSAVGGTASIAGTNVLFTPTSNYVGTASFVYTLQDNGTTAGANDFKNGTATVSFNLLAVAPGIKCPGSIATNASGYCPVTVVFNATATGVPAPTLSYKLGATPITSPYAFPVGTNTVSVTATNGALPDANCSFIVTVAAGPAPQLGILRSGANVVVSWTNLFPCYTLQFAPLLASNSWSIYPGPFATNAGRIFVTNSAPLTNRFYRLAY